MSDEQKAAFLNAAAACLIAEVLGMQAENLVRANSGLSPAYDSEAFFAAIDRSPCNHNAAIQTLRGE